MLDSVAGSSVVRVMLLPLLVFATGAYVSATLQSTLAPIREQVTTMAVELRGVSKDVTALTAVRDSLVSQMHELTTQLAVLQQRVSDKELPRGNK